MKYWWIVLSPFVLAALILAVIHGCEAWAKWRDKCAMRIRDSRISRFGLGPISGTRDRWPS